MWLQILFNRPSYCTVAYFCNLFRAMRNPLAFHNFIPFAPLPDKESSGGNQFVPVRVIQNAGRQIRMFRDAASSHTHNYKEVVRLWTWINYATFCGVLKTLNQESCNVSASYRTVQHSPIFRSSCIECEPWRTCLSYLHTVAIVPRAYVTNRLGEAACLVAFRVAFITGILQTNISIAKVVKLSADFLGLQIFWELIMAVDA